MIWSKSIGNKVITTIDIFNLYHHCIKTNAPVVINSFYDIAGGLIGSSDRIKYTSIV